jgi:hypothetical protein
MRRIERASTIVLGIGAILTAATIWTFAHATAHQSETTRLSRNRALVTALDLTDLALFNDARYTRNPSQADLHSAFQDGPLTFEHFPTGSLVPPPVSLLATGDQAEWRP